MARKKFQPVNDAYQTGQRATTDSPPEPLLSPTRAFVVQFREEMETEPRRFAGRVEHLVSGRASRFHSPEELLAFFTQVLGTTATKPPAQT